MFKLGWKARVDIVVIAAMVGGAAAMLPGHWLQWPPPARKAVMIATSWIVLAIGLSWAARATDRPHQIVLFKPGPVLGASALRRNAVAILEIVLVGAFLWLLLYG